MRFSLEWIREMVPDAPASPQAIADALTGAGLAIETIEEVREGDTVVDHALEIEITTNRPDAMCHRGLARELAAIFDVPLVDTDPAPPTDGTENAADAASLVVEEPELCPSYVALVLRDVEVGPSPEWLQRRLRAIGARPINNVVDVTNFVLWETGQPLHAFDLDRIGGREIRVRRARDEENLRTLDDENRVLSPSILAIADAEEAIGLGGIMGGLDSEVTSETRHVLLESAHFDPDVVRKGARSLGMHTDASHRFERGVDPTGCRRAALRAAELILASAGGRLLSGALDETRLPERFPQRVALDHSKLERFAGIPLPAADVERILDRLGFDLEATGDGGWTVTVPPWRWYDFENPYPADLYEEVLRIHGFDRIPATLPAISGADPGTGPAVGRRRRIREQLAASGLAEAIHLAFHDRESAERYPGLLGEGPPVEVANPVSERYAVMRRSLVPGLVESALYNLRRGRSAVRLFEVGHVFAAAEGAAKEPETETVAFVMGGTLGTPWEGPRDLDLYDLKGVLEGLGRRFRVDLEVVAAPIPATAPGSSGEVRLDGRPIGWLGRIDDDALIVPLWAAEITVDALDAGRPPQVELPSRFPAVEVDLTLTHDLETPWSTLATSIAELRPENLASFALKDRYRGQGVPDGAVNTTVSFLYVSEDRSLTQDEVNARHLALADELSRRHGHSPEERR